MKRSMPLTYCTVQIDSIDTAYLLCYNDRARGKPVARSGAASPRISASNLSPCQAMHSFKVLA